ncbi:MULTISPECIES: hypothetical protein [Protofrankia]|uniref:O-antigen polysaccharide polymerase Wzy n=1 Tax=Protofrankia coriariae TaxID=1562887 RepID=A0ABR5F5I3_9ACTN|nr:MULTISPECIES: hypothetical protein [Protofrankia]KLL11940.1 hypothetical protein FrCorBMG51_07945 [Protofrankia coriariae]ONH36822.1 hypothetical protein BL254_06240 [Protofrankia sp. BMG5.30]
MTVPANVCAQGEREPLSFSGILLSVAGAVLAVLLYLFAGIFPVSQSTDMVLRSLSVVLVAGVALGLVAQRAPGRCFGLASLRMGPVYVVWVALAFGAASVAWRKPPESSLLGQVYRNSVLEGLTLVMVGLVFWTVGYLVGPGALATRAGRRLGRLAAPGHGFELRFATVPWVLAGVAAAARLVQLGSGNFAYLGDPAAVMNGSSRFAQVIGVLASCGTFSLIVAAMDLARHRSGRRWFTFVTLLSLEIGVGLVGGMKQSFLLAIFGPAVVFALMGRGFPVKSTVLAGLAFTLVVMPFNAQYRDTVRTHTHALDTTQAVGVAPSIMREVLDPKDPRETVLDSFSALLERIREIDAVAIVVQRTPEIFPYRDPGELLFAPVLGLIPRAVWHDKPVLNAGYRFNQQYWGQDSSIYSAASITPQADLYVHGGIIVLMIGMIFLGAMMRLVDKVFHPSVDPRLMLLFLPLLLLLVKSESDVAILLASLPTQIVACVAVIRFAFVGKNVDSEAVVPGGPTRRF